MAVNLLALGLFLTYASLICPPSIKNKPSSYTVYTSGPTAKLKWREPSCGLCCTKIVKLSGPPLGSSQPRGRYHVKYNAKNWGGLIFSSTSFYITVANRQCPRTIPTTRINHGWVKCTDGHKEGSECSVHCDSGYADLSGVRVKCRGSGGSGSWSDPATVLVCSATVKAKDRFGGGQPQQPQQLLAPGAVACLSAPPALPGMSVKCTSSSYTIGSTCSYSCGPGLVVPVSQRGMHTQCDISQTWRSLLNNIKPTCILDAPPLMTNCSLGVTRQIATVMVTLPFPYPIFTSADGTRPISHNCGPYKNPTYTFSYGNWPIQCTGLDPEVQKQSTCAFNVTVNRRPLFFQDLSDITQ